MVPKVFKKTNGINFFFYRKQKFPLKRSLNKKEKKKNMKGENVKIEWKKYWKKNLTWPCCPKRGSKAPKTGMNVNFFLCWLP